ncbi:RNA polymerase sigma factor [Solitalea lacus]|uniref:RNA polymerase sigma factor n=1 Tax=Solitalea lacus TaxID=2911172 RepID=UPI001EDBAB9B|nr:RNA polymerase sigma-70 factor [Solitalea lacus]UKJ06783.1 RNA polymerase sigma-70 factor [Solitalea lacus]
MITERDTLNSLLLRIVEGDETAFRLVFNEYSGKVYTFALKLTHSETLAEEIVQDIFMKVWLNRQALLTINYFPSYLYALTKNHTFNVLKRLTKEANIKAAISLDLSEIQHETEGRIVFNEYERILKEAIDKLPPQQRKVYTMCHLDGMTYEEAAQLLNLSKLTVKTHVQQALRFVRGYFNSHLNVWVLSVLLLSNKINADSPASNEMFPFSDQQIQDADAISLQTFRLKAD